MNRGTRMSSALALVTPRPAGQHANNEPVEATVEATIVAEAAGEPTLAVVAQVPDLHPGKPTAATTAGTHQTPSTHAPSAHVAHSPVVATVVDAAPSPLQANWQLARQKSRLAYHKAAAALSNIDMAKCWAWVITLPPIVKLGTMMAALVMSIWVFGGNNDEPKADATPASAWQETTIGRASQDADSTSITAKSSDSLWRPGRTGNFDASDTAGNDTPSIRDIQAAARGGIASQDFNDGWPRDRSDDPSIASAKIPGSNNDSSNVRPIPSHKEPYDSQAMPYDASSRTDIANNSISRGDATRGVVPVSRDEFNRPPVNGSRYENSADRAPQPPVDMPQRWAERPQPSQTTDHSPVQNNPYYSNTASANTGGRGYDNPGYDNRANDSRVADNRPVEDRRVDDRMVDYRYAGNGNGSQPANPQYGNDRFGSDRMTTDRVAEDHDAEAARRQRAYQIGREQDRAQRPDYSDTYRR